MLDYTRSSSYRYFVQHAPKRPFASSCWSNGASSLPKREALKHRNIQLQPLELRGSIAVDLDSEMSYQILQETDFPKPQLVMVNPKNGHAHAVWQLEDPVAFTLKARRKPQAAFQDLRRQITTLYGSDPAYSGFMVKTPGHPDWETVANDASPYSMSLLLEAIPAGIAEKARCRKELKVSAEGRHQTLFEVGRKWAYREIHRYRNGGDCDEWGRQVEAALMEMNTFSPPLALNEVKSLARSIARYCWQNRHKITARQGVLFSDKRSLIPSWERPPALPPEEARARMAKGAVYVHALRKAKTAEAITNAIASLIASGITNPTAAQITQASGVSRATVDRFRKALAESAE